MMRLAIAFSIYGNATGVCGQYLQFSQYEFTTQRINPAMTGASHYITLDLDSRTQKTGGDFDIHSNYFAAALPLLHPGTGKPWSGIGISVMDDRAGGIFQRQEAALSYAVHVQLNRNEQLSLGFKALYQTSRISTDGLTTGSQYVPDRGFNSALSTGESFADTRSHYTTFSAGLNWQKTDRKGGVVAHWGLSFFDLNSPSFSYYGNGNASLPVTFVFSGGFQLYKRNKRIISPELLFTNSSGTRVINGGFRFRFEFPSTPLQIPDQFDIIARYVPGRSGILGAQLHREKISFGISYDFPVLRTNSGNTGALEIGLTGRILVESRNKKIARRKELEREKNRARLRRPKPGIKKDSSSVAGIPKPVEIVVVDSAAQKPGSTTTIETDAQAGKIKHEPFEVEKITLHFNFEYNSTDLDDETEDFLRKLGTTLLNDPSLTLMITGHTDNIGGDKFNVRLSHRRAETVRAFLVHLGIVTGRIITDGKGFATPLVTNDSEENRAKNRRVEIIVLRP